MSDDIDQGHPFQQEQLGELPDDISIERGDYKTYYKTTERGPPPDIVQQHKKKQADTGEIGSSSQGSNVVSTYDVRPVNNQEFIISTNGNVNTCDSTDKVLTFEVPQSRVAVFRSIRWQLWVSGNMSFPYFQDPNVAASMSLLVTVNGAPVENVTQNSINSLQGVGSDWQEIYFVVPEGSLVEIAMLHSFCDDDQVVGHIDMRGQLLLSRGLPDNYEIGSLPYKPEKAIVPQSQKPKPKPKQKLNRCGRPGPLTTREKIWGCQQKVRGGRTK